MKTIFTSFLTILMLIGSLNSQTVYKINSSEIWNNNGSASYPNPCFKCTFALAENVVLTIEKDVTFSDVKFDGGTIIVNKKNLMLWTAGGKNIFNNTKLSFIGDGQFTANGPLVLNNTKFDFFGKSNLLSNHALELFSSTIAFKEKSFLVGQGSIISLTNSHLVAGDGLLTSTANIQMNGAKLVLQDQVSGVEVLNKNNYYFNWSNYTAAASNQSFKTTDIKTNCGANGPNACSTPVLYGPIALTPTGLGSALTLPVVIGNFTAANSNKAVSLNWSTTQESNSASFTIERSVDGFNWSAIGQVKAAGNSAIVSKYSFTDYTTINGAAYYRLKMVDLDNKSVYSDVKSVRSSATASVKIFPNPAAEFVNITLNVNGGKSTVRLINQAGQVLHQQVAASNTNFISLPLSQITNGVYTISVVNDNGTEAIRLIVQHTK